MVLEQGTLIGQYDTAHPMIAGSARAETYKPILNQIEILNTQWKRIAENHVDAARIPVALAIAKGNLPIIGVTKPKHVKMLLKWSIWSKVVKKRLIIMI